MLVAFEGSIIRTRTIWILIGLLLLALAATIDERAAQWMHAHVSAAAVRTSRWAKIVKSPGDFRFTLVVGAIILGCRFRRWRQVVALLVGGVLAGLIYTAVKWLVGRSRPFPQNKPHIPPFELHPLPLGLRGLWKADNLSFPSGHVCLAFATAASLAMIWPRGAILFFGLAGLVGLERILEGAHYPSDVVGGAIFGILAAWVAVLMVRRLFWPAPEPRGFEISLLRDGDEP